MAGRYEAEQDEWFEQLDDDKLRSVLEDIARLKPVARKAAMAKPLAAFERAGLPRPPKGVTVKLAEHKLSEFGDRPKFPDLERLFEIPHLRFFCFTICRWVPWIVGGIPIGLRRVCRLVCIRI